MYRMQDILFGLLLICLKSKLERKGNKSEQFNLYQLSVRQYKEFVIWQTYPGTGYDENVQL